MAKKMGARAGAKKQVARKPRKAKQQKSYFGGTPVSKGDHITSGSSGGIKDKSVGYNSPYQERTSGDKSENGTVGERPMGYPGSVGQRSQGAWNGKSYGIRVTQAFRGGR